MDFSANTNVSTSTRINQFNPKRMKKKPDAKAMEAEMMKMAGKSKKKDKKKDGKKY